MNKISQIAKKIKPLNARMGVKAQKRLDSLTKPQGSLGRLEELARNLVAMTAKENPTLNHKVIFTLAADHGITDEGVSAFPKSVTAQMVYNFIRGGAGINVLARHAGARVVIADLGVAEDLKPHPKLTIVKINYGTQNMLKVDAMTADEAERSVEAGIMLVEKECKKGLDLVATGEMGIGNTTASSAITAVMTGQDVSAVTGRGTGIKDHELKRKISIIRQAIRRRKPDPRDAMDVLAKVGGFEIGGLAGVMLAAASKRIPIVIDGFISGAAALIACGIEPKAREYLIASHSSVERGHRIILDHLRLKPIMDLNLRLGEGTGAALGMDIVEASLRIMTEMATFQSAGVSGKTKS